MTLNLKIQNSCAFDLKNRVSQWENTIYNEGKGSSKLKQAQKWHTKLIGKSMKMSTVFHVFSNSEHCVGML